MGTRQGEETTPTEQKEKESSEKQTEAKESSNPAAANSGSSLSQRRLPRGPPSTLESEEGRGVFGSWRKGAGESLKAATGKDGAGGPGSPLPTYSFDEKSEGSRDWCSTSKSESQPSGEGLLLSLFVTNIPFPLFPILSVANRFLLPLKAIK